MIFLEDIITSLTQDLLYHQRIPFKIKALTGRPRQLIFHPRFAFLLPLPMGIQQTRSPNLRRPGP